MKKITVITICFNEAETIKRTMDSVLYQTYSDFEYIVKDGNSNDKTNEIINSYKTKFEERGIQFTHLIGDDSGIYDAMNIALKYAVGEWINFMNSGDSFYNNQVLEDIFQYKEWENKGILYGHTLLELERGYKFVQINNHNSLYKGVGISQQVCFARRNLLDKFLLSKRYKILADYDFLLRVKDADIEFGQLNIIVANYNRKGISSKHIYEATIEQNDILMRYKKSNSLSIFTKVYLKIKTLFSELCPMFSDFLFCKHISRKM